VEIKSRQTIRNDFFKNLDYYNKISKNPTKNSYLIYGGDQKQKRQSAKVVPWREVDREDLA